MQMVYKKLILTEEEQSTSAQLAICAVMAILLVVKDATCGSSGTAKVVVWRRFSCTVP